MQYTTFFVRFSTFQCNSEAWVVFEFETKVSFTYNNFKKDNSTRGGYYIICLDLEIKLVTLPFCFLIRLHNKRDLHIEYVRVRYTGYISTHRL